MLIINMETRKNIVFLSSSFVNLAKLYAEENSKDDVFLVSDRKFPFDYDESENFYPFTFNQEKLFDKNKEKYFDSLAVFLTDFNPDVIICNNFTKLLSKSFIEFMKFRNPKIKILNLHHADLRILENGQMKYSGLNADIKQFLDDEEIVTTIHLIENEEMDNGKQLIQSHSTSLKELKQKGFINKKEEIFNFRMRNVVLSYHERTKVLKLLISTLENE